MSDPSDEYLDLLDWRRRVAALWARWRTEAAANPAAATTAFRAARDRLFREHPQSPLPPEGRASFRGLAHWPYDPAWRMTARLEPVAAESDAAHMAALPSSGPDALAYRRIGSVALSGPLARERLPVFWIAGYAGGLFLPFRDTTSGTESYGAGRYLLDTLKSADHGTDPATGELILDFNMAFHPSCAYDPRWSCPLAPPESRLAVAVRAGERLA
jgi:uncharacterized protein (DUF1684 family)